MRSGKRWHLALATAVLVAVPVLVSSSYSAAQPGEPDGAQSAAASDWVGSWGTALTAAEPGATHISRAGFTNRTVRMFLHLSVGGDQVRVRLSNVFGEGPMTIGAATVALPELTTPRRWDFDPATLHTLTFNGRPSVTMLKGQEALSDPVDFRLPDQQTLILNVFFPTASGPLSWHATAKQETFVGPDNLTADPSVTSNRFNTVFGSWFDVSGVDVLRRKANGAIVVVGDSLGAGNGTTLNANKRWPDLLAARLLGGIHNGKVPAVMNASLAGNRLDHDGPEPACCAFPGFVQLGANAGARLNEDVFPQTGVSTVILDLGINDIWMNGDSADAIISSIRQAGAQVRERGLRFVVATLGPYEGFAVDPDVGPVGEWTPAKEATRNAVNDFLRSSGEFDGVIDFDSVLRDPAAPSKLRAEFDSGDHIHPNDAGNQAMADAVPLNLVD